MKIIRSHQLIVKMFKNDQCTFQIANNKGADQTVDLHANNTASKQHVHLSSLISAFVIRYQESIVVILSPCTLSIF